MKKLSIPLLIFTCHLFFYFPAKAQRYAVVIDELMVDPAPQVGLPNNEWIELRNVTPFPVNLSGWKISDATNHSGPMPNFILKPDSLVIVCSGSAAAAMSAFGTTITVTGFPSLDNNGDQVSLADANGNTIHAIAYDNSWYQNELKKEGGWTLEMMDTNNPCAGSNNWKACIDNAGGTPGRRNSIDGINTDQLSPQLKRAYTLDSLNIVLVFDEPVDSLKAASSSNYSVDGGLIIAGTTSLAPVFDKVQLKLSTPMQGNTIYTVTANNITDCKNNVIGSLNKIKIGLPADPVKGEIIVNEVLFNPRSNAYDYVEFYNRSNNIVDASHLYIANRNTNSTISSITPLSLKAWLIFPGDYVVVTEDASSLSREYLVKNPDEVLSLTTFPSFPDDKGYVVLLNFQGNVIDEVDYSDDWHFKLLANDEGVALERIDPDAASQEQSNWHSAGSTAGYGTPTYKNSQYKQLQNINVSFEITPRAFSPDNDGFDDVATIQYKTNAPGYVANITIFDAAGRPIRNLVRNGILALSGYWNWDGLDDTGKKLPVGTYILFTEIFNLEGKKSKFKNTVVLARKLY